MHNRFASLMLYRGRVLLRRWVKSVAAGQGRTQRLRDRPRGEPLFRSRFHYCGQRNSFLLSRLSCHGDGFGGNGRGGVNGPLTNVGSMDWGSGGSRGSGADRNFMRGNRLIEAKLPANFQRNVIVNRAGMRLLFVDAQFGEQFQDFVRLYFELTGQLVDSNFTHI